MKIIRTSYAENVESQSAQEPAKPETGKKPLSSNRASAGNLTTAEFRTATNLFQTYHDPGTDPALKAEIEAVLNKVELNTNTDPSQAPSTPPSKSTRLGFSSAERLLKDVYSVHRYAADVEVGVPDSAKKSGEWPQNAALTKEKFGERALVRDKKGGGVYAVSHHQKLGRDSEAYFKFSDLSCSVFPHWTPAAPGQNQKIRPAHFTDCVAVTTTNLRENKEGKISLESAKEYKILVRTHQDDAPKSKVQFDRMIATDPSGKVHKVGYIEKKGVHSKAKENFPVRGDTVSPDMLLKLVEKYSFYVTHEDNKTPDISPDSSNRDLTTHGKSKVARKLSFSA